MDNVNFQAAQKKLQDSIIKEGVETGNITMIKIPLGSYTPGTLNMKGNGTLLRTINFKLFLFCSDLSLASEIVDAINQCRPSSLNPDVEKPSQFESSSNSITTTPFMDSPRSRNPSPSSLDLEREEEKEKRAAEEQKEAEGKARKLAKEKAGTVASKQAQREEEENARKRAAD
ncbi:hypothetical protein EV368DRAFT_69222 [Lentinula lateritia]|uniref:Uncharacterized protein n=1 Tax=Lentinula aff. lateritia TaxID=2804960 RepID=A0ACC1TP84_9AGAR|nr:hypothetical protein F5876DRAFT_68889 [Lentinula aff. lateritia]KAJ3847296.1 hypothetical protein EV368DRAFT_69222 [Lentinula lateritia]